jgi:multicomponent Na+:H+ antiporter subunit E
MTLARVVLVAWLTVVWALLWGTAHPAALLSGVAVGGLAVAACRLPRVPLTARPRPWKLLRALGDFAVELTASSLDLAWASLRHGRATSGGIVAVPLRCPTDVAALVVANRISATPGTVVVDVDRHAGIFFVYVVPLRRREDADDARDEAQRVGHQLLQALGHETDHQT